MITQKIIPRNQMRKNQRILKVKANLLSLYKSKNHSKKTNRIFRRITRIQTRILIKTTINFRTRISNRNHSIKDIIRKSKRRMTLETRTNFKVNKAKTLTRISTMEINSTKTKVLTTKSSKNNYKRKFLFFSISITILM